MTVPAIGILIDKRDNFEIIRDQIAQILADGTVEQQALAVLAAKDPVLWKLRVFIERALPWEQCLNAPDTADRSPIINVWFDNTAVNMRSSNTVERQKYDGVFNIDCYGFGLARDDEVTLTDQIPGDEDAAKEAQRAARLVRNILMAGVNTYLGMRGIVWSRMVRSITAFQPTQGEVRIPEACGVRVTFEVGYNELSEQVPGELAELVTIEVKRAEDGSVVATCNYDYTP